MKHTHLEYIGFKLPSPGEWYARYDIYGKYEVVLQQSQIQFHNVEYECYRFVDNDLPAPSSNSWGYSRFIPESALPIQFDGKPLDYWLDLQVIMDTYMIKTPEELEERINFITNHKNNIERVLLRSTRDRRQCPHCGDSFVPADATAREAWDLYRLFHGLVAPGTPLTDRFDEWNW